MPRRPPDDWTEHDVQGYTVLVGNHAKANDRLTFREASPLDAWLHAAGCPGSHVVVKNPHGDEVPRAVLKRAAELAAFHSKMGTSSRKVPVHVTRACDVTKPRGAPPGQVRLRAFDELKVYPRA